MPPEKVATAVTMTSKSREISGCMRLSWYSDRPPAMRPIPSSSAGLKSTFTIAHVLRAGARIEQRLGLLCRACQAARLQLALVGNRVYWLEAGNERGFLDWCISACAPLRRHQGRHAAALGHTITVDTALSDAFAAMATLHLHLHPHPHPRLPAQQLRWQKPVWWQ